MEPFELRSAPNRPSLLTISAWEREFPRLTAGFTARGGGVSKAPYATLNLGLHVADRPEDVVCNRGLVAEAVGVPLDSWVYAEQVHGNEVAVITRAEAGRGIRSRADALQGKDAFVTSEKGLCLAALFADCVPLYFYDPVHQACGLAHAGWKGTVNGIARETIRTMEAAFGSKPEELAAAIGPSIGVCCYEVDDRVVDHVRVLELGDESRLFLEQGYGKYRLNLQEINRQIMIKAGILPHRIELSEMCTSCHTDRFFSHRKENGTTGRMIAWMALKA